MAEQALQLNQQFDVDGQAFEVVTVSHNDQEDFFVYEIKTVADADKKREANEADRVAEAEAAGQPTDTEAPTA